MNPVIFIDKEQEYIKWIKANQNGFVLTTNRSKSKNYMSLHKASCRMISQYMRNMKKGAFTERAYIKICSNDVISLDSWIKKEGGDSFTTVCSICEPDISSLLIPKKKGTEILAPNKWKQYLVNRNHEFHLFRANTEVAKNTDLQDSTKRLIKIDFEDQLVCPIQDFFAITSGKEVALPKPIQNMVKDYKEKYPNSFITFEIIDFDHEEDSVEDEYDEETETIRGVITRIKQKEFRDALIKKHKICQLTGLKDTQLLIASHIKPWSKSNNKERTDINNGFLLSSNVDALFDKGYISFNDNGEVIFSSKCNQSVLSIFNIPNKKIKIENAQKTYLRWHRENIFKN